MSVTFYETLIAAGEDKPGDILSWRKAEMVEGVSSGHTLMIAGLPKEERDDRFRVRVIDSTRKPHANDTRPAGTLGKGSCEMGFTVDRAGKLVGFYVDDESGHSTSHKIAIGRIAKPGGQPDDPSNGKTKGALDGRRSFERNAKSQDANAKPDSGDLKSDDHDFIELRMSAATRLAEKRSIEWRVIDEDGETVPVKISLTEERLNFVVERGKVIRVIRG